MDTTLRAARRIAVAVVGATMLLIGVAMLVLPGPGVVVIAAGVSVLGTEFVWARRFLQQAREAVSQIKAKASL